MVAPGGRTARYRVTMTFSDTDHYEFLLEEVRSDGSMIQRVRVNYARVATAPEPFHKQKPAR